MAKKAKTKVKTAVKKPAKSKRVRRQNVTTAALGPLEAPNLELDLLAARKGRAEAETALAEAYLQVGNMKVRVKEMEATIVELRSQMTTLTRRAAENEQGEDIRRLANRLIVALAGGKVDVPEEWP